MFATMAPSYSYEEEDSTFWAKFSLSHFVVVETVPVRTVNRQCSSGLQAVADVAAAIKAGFYDIGNCSMLNIHASFAAVILFQC